MGCIVLPSTIFMFRHQSNAWAYCARHRSPGRNSPDPNPPHSRRYSSRLTPSKQPSFQAAAFENLSGAARTKISPPQLLVQFLFAVNDPLAALYFRLRWITLSAFAHRLDENGSSSGFVCRMAHLPLQKIVYFARGEPIAEELTTIPPDRPRFARRDSTWPVRSSPQSHSDS